MNIGRVVGAAIAIAGIVVVVAAEGQRDRAAGSAADRDQITATVARWEAAWNTHDMTAFASLFHDDGVWVLRTGDVWTSRRRAMIEDGHAAVHKTIFATAFNASTSKS